MSHLLIALAAALALAGPAAARSYEEAFQTTAAEVLSDDLQGGDGWAVADPVEADGVNHVFDLETHFGPMRADGRILLHHRIVEIRAIQLLEEESATEEFAEAFAKAGTMPLFLVKDLATQPGETASGWGRGMWKAIKKTFGWLAGDRRQRADTENSATREAIGFNRTKRRRAAELDVDPYTDNEQLQEHLNRVAWAEFAGGLAPKIVVAAISVPAVSHTYRATSVTNGPRKLVQSMSGGDLHRKNRALLRGQGLDPDRVETFLDKPELSPTVKTAVTLDVLALEDVAGRQHVIERAIELPDEEEGARFALNSAVTTGYHRSIEPVGRVVRLGDQLVVATKSGKLVAARSADELLWTPANAELARAMAEEARRDPELGSVELWITGRASGRSRRELAALGIDLHEEAFEALTECFLATPDEAGDELVEREKELESREKARPPNRK